MVYAAGTTNAALSLYGSLLPDLFMPGSFWGQPHDPLAVSHSYHEPMTISYKMIVFSQGTLVPGSDFALGSSLVAEVERTPDGVVIQSGFLDEAAYGASFATAWMEFLTSLRDRLVSLKKRSKLSNQDAAVLKRLEGLLVSRPVLYLSTGETSAVQVSSS